MAIQNRRGAYTDLDTTKLLAGEYAVVLSGDPSDDDGVGVYVGYGGGEAKRLALADEVTDMTSGTFEQLTAGAALQLDSSIIHTDSEPYLFRKTPYGTRAFPKLVGASVGWNQLVANTGSSLSVTVTNGHKYVMKKSGTWSIGSSVGSAITGLTGGTDIVTDITLLLGMTIADYAYTLETGTAGAGIAWLRKYGFFTKAYYPYDAGSIQSVKTSKHVTVGFNQYDNSTGKAKVIGGTQYYIGGTYTSLTLTDASGNTSTITPVSHLFTPSVSGEITVTGGGSDTCINISNPQKNGQYEPYVKHEYALDADLTLRGIYKKDASNNLYCDGDTYEADGTVVRKYKVVTFDGSNDENWQHPSGTNRFYISIADIKGTADDATMPDLICSRKYTVHPYNLATDHAPVIASRNASTAHQINFFDNDYDSLNAFKSALASNPITVVYDLLTPTTETADAFTVPQICDSNGTEEYVDTRTVPVPVGHNTETPADLRGKVEQLYGIPEPPTSNGTYTLKCTVSGGKPTYSWST